MRSLASPHSRFAFSMKRSGFAVGPASPVYLAADHFEYIGRDFSIRPGGVSW
jgi:hypothetical protein